MFTTDYDMARNGGLEKPKANTSLKDSIKYFILFYGLFPLLVPLFLIKNMLKGEFNWSGFIQLYKVVSAAHNDPINLQPSKMLISKVWALASAKHYAGRLEWQIREGYCAPATLRCILKSFSSFPINLLPEQVHGPSEPVKWCAQIQELSKEHEEVPKLKTEIVRGDVGYEIFLEKLRKALAQSNNRVAINYLRPSLTGFKKPWWIPIHFFFGLVSGHFSPILGIMESTTPGAPPLIAVFDLNAAYGMYLVEAPRLYQSINARDVSSGKSRGIIIVSDASN